MRTKAWRLQNLKRILKKRLRIIKEWSAGMEKPHPWEMEPHRAHKFNLNCGCKMCHYYKYVGNSKEGLTHKERSARNAFKEEKDNVINS